MLLNPLPLSQTVTHSRTPSPLERDVLYGRPPIRKHTLQRKVRLNNFNFNFRLHMYDRKFKSVKSHALDPPLSKTVTPSQTSPKTPIVTYFMDSPYKE